MQHIVMHKHLQPHTTSQSPTIVHSYKFIQSSANWMTTINHFLGVFRAKATNLQKGQLEERKTLLFLGKEGMLLLKGTDMMQV